MDFNIDSLDIEDLKKLKILVDSKLKEKKKALTEYEKKKLRYSIKPDEERKGILRLNKKKYVELYTGYVDLGVDINGKSNDKEVRKERYKMKSQYIGTIGKPETFRKIQELEKDYPGIIDEYNELVLKAREAGGIENE